jgi:hypothetical protein
MSLEFRPGQVTMFTQVKATLSALSNDLEPVLSALQCSNGHALTDRLRATFPVPGSISRTLCKLVGIFAAELEAGQVNGDRKGEGNNINCFTS